MMKKSSAIANLALQSGLFSSQASAVQASIDIEKLIDAFEQANLEEVAAIVSLNPGVALLKAVDSTHIPLVRWIIEHHKQSVDAIDPDGNTCLHLAVIRANPELVNLFLNAQSALALLQNKKGWTALHLAVLKSNFFLIVLLLRTDKACVESEIIARNMFPFLSEKFVNNLSTHFFKDPSVFSISNVRRKVLGYHPEHLSIIEVLLSAKPETNRIIDAFSQTPLSWCVRFCNFNVFEAMYKLQPETIDELMNKNRLETDKNLTNNSSLK